MVTLKLKIMKNLLLSLTLLSLSVTMLNAQTVSHFDVADICSSNNLSAGTIYFTGAYTLSQCINIGSINLTWNGYSYTTNASGLSGSTCSHNKGVSCIDGNPPTTFPATIVIHSPASIAGTYTTDGSGNITSYVLPVELISFTAKQDKQSIQLDWQTASEENNEGFEVQRSNNGEEWEVLDFVEGNGTTLEVQNYTYTDEESFAGVNYYRLKQIDFDGQFEYSEIVNISQKISNISIIEIFPNPVTDGLNIVGAEGKVTIYNILGQPMKQFTVSDENSSIDVVDLPKGQYILRIQQQNGNMVTKQFVK